MRARNGSDEITPLPRPPAPTARDANPWPIPGRDAAARRPRLPPAPRGPGTEPRTGHGALHAAVGIAVGVAVLAAALIQARDSGRLSDLAGPAIMLFMVALFVISRRRSARRRARRNSAEAPGD